MAQLAVLTVTVAAGAADQVVAHGLVRTPTIIAIVEKDEAEVKLNINTRNYAVGGVAIATLAPQVQLVAAIVFSVNNLLYARALADNFWDLTGFDVTNGMYNVCLLGVSTAGAATIGAGVEAATLAGVVLPDTPAISCVVATLEVNPTGAGNFVGGTTDLDDAGVVPNAVYTDVGGHPDAFGEVTQGAAADATNIYLNNSMQRARDVYVFVFAPHSIIL